MYGEGLAPLADKVRTGTGTGACLTRALYGMDACAACGLRPMGGPYDEGLAPLADRVRRPRAVRMYCRLYGVERRVAAWDGARAQRAARARRRCSSGYS